MRVIVFSEGTTCVACWEVVSSRKFVLNKDKKLGIMESLESFVGSLRGHSDHGNLLTTNVDISELLQRKSHCTCSCSEHALADLLTRRHA